MHAQDILKFWFEELDNQQRFAKDIALDRMLRARFDTVLQAASRGELFKWRTTPQGRLAEIIVLDQFSRNIHRETAAAFAQDAQALTLAQELVASGQDYVLDAARRTFAYMPYMHSESPLIHTQAVALFSQTGMEGSLAYERRHKAIIDQFGRYPHRNAILGRASTTEEIAFLKQPEASF